MKILDGKKLGDQIADRLQQEISNLDQVPHLVIIQIGHIPESDVYIGMKVKFAERIGARTTVKNFPNEIKTEELVSEIEKLNSDKDINGIIMQLPIPDHVDKTTILNSISPEKDVDGLNSINIAKLVRNENGIIPATAKGVVTLLKENGIEIAGKLVAVIGRSVLVGKTTALHFINNDATVTLCHKHTKNLSEKTKPADILVVATGNPKLITPGHTNPSQIIVDVGISVAENGTISGDVDAENVNADSISPVPGGVGPMTVASLFENLIEAFNVQRSL